MEENGKSNKIETELYMTEIITIANVINVNRNTQQHRGKEEEK